MVHLISFNQINIIFMINKIWIEKYYVSWINLNLVKYYYIIILGSTNLNIIIVLFIRPI